MVWPHLATIGSIEESEVTVMVIVTAVGRMVMRIWFLARPLHMSKAAVAGLLKRGIALLATLGASSPWHLPVAVRVNSSVTR